MIVSKSTCGLCKPAKKFKRNRTRLRNIFSRALDEENPTSNLITVYTKRYN